jgi:hypothetical protein
LRRAFRFNQHDCDHREVGYTPAIFADKADLIGMAVAASQAEFRPRRKDELQMAFDLALRRAIRSELIVILRVGNRLLCPRMIGCFHDNQNCRGKSSRER